MVESTTDPPSAGLSTSEAEYRAAERAALDAIDRDEHEITEADRRAIRLWTSGLPEDEHPIQIAGLGDPGIPPRFVVEDLLPEGQGVFLCGEEGSGKSYLAWQIAGEMTRGVPVLDRFAVPAPVRSVLIVDVEQSPEDVRIIRDEMVRRGTIDVTSPIYFLDANGRYFDDPEDFVWLVRQVKAIRPDVLIVDTVTDAVSKPRDDESVSALTFLFGRFIHNDGVRAIVGLAQPRKLSGDSGRTFDSLFGSRKWKSWASAVYWLEEKKLAIWKQRGSYLARRWPRENGERYAWVPLERPAEGPPTVVGSKAAVQMERDADRVRRAADTEGRVLRWIGANPGSSTRAIRDGEHVRRDDMAPILKSLELMGKIENRSAGRQKAAWYVTGPTGPNQSQPVPMGSVEPVPETSPTAPYVGAGTMGPVRDPEEDR